VLSRLQHWYDTRQDSFCADSCSFGKRFLLVLEAHEKTFFGSKQPRTLNSRPIRNNPRVSPLRGGGRQNQADLTHQRGDS